MYLNCSKRTILAAVCSVLMLGAVPQAFAAGGKSPVPVPVPAVQQAKKITGTVSDQFGPVIGATVRVKGSSNGVITDMDGNFTLNAKPGEIIEVSFVGYLPKTFTVGSAARYDVTIEEDHQNLQEVVVVGYGTMKKSDLAGASASMDEKAIKGTNITNIDQAFLGRATGVNSVQTSGAPGSASSVRVRGQATINANAEPLYVVARNAQEFTEIQATYPTKMVVLGECGKGDSGEQGLIDDCWTQGALWGHFMVWYQGGQGSTDTMCSDNWWKKAMSSEHVITRDQLPSLRH